MQTNKPAEKKEDMKDTKQKFSKLFGDDDDDDY
jgi:hypothetical protein